MPSTGYLAAVADDDADPGTCPAIVREEQCVRVCSGFQNDDHTIPPDGCPIIRHQQACLAIRSAPPRAAGADGTGPLRVGVGHGFQRQ